MATLILRDTHLELQEEIKDLAKFISESSAKIHEASSLGDL